MKVSFVIPIFNHFDLINTLLADILRHCTPDEILVINDCSNDQETLTGISWWEFNTMVRVVRTPENLGFLKTANFGISKASGDIVCLISSDVRIEDDLAKSVRELIELDPKVLIGGILYEHDTGWNQVGGKIYKYLEGWLLCCLKSTWEDLGGFDELYCPNDFEDVDVSTTALQKGYSLIPLNNPKIRHLGGGSIGYNDTRMALTVRNKAKFEAKWTTNTQLTTVS